MYKLLAPIMAAAMLLPLLASPVQARAVGRGEASIARRATAAVVNISTWKLKPAMNQHELPRRVKVFASGFVIDPSGIIVTNKHVVDGALGLTVTFDDGHVAPARLLVAAAMLDIALLKVDVTRKLPALRWGDSDALEVGDSVLTIGNPLGIGISVSAGIVSALNRDLQDSPFDSYIQTDAAINHGNSGGPLVNAEGEAVGIDTALYNPDENGGFIGIGFAIPSNAARFVVNFLLDPLHPKPGWLGFTLQDMSAELAEALGTPDANGAIISALVPGSPADRAGLRLGDVLQTLDGERQTDARAFMRSIVMTPVGRKVRLTARRDGAQQEVTTTVEDWPDYKPDLGAVNAETAAMMIGKEPDPGIRITPLTDEARKQYDIDPSTAGVLISSVEPECEARDLGVRPGNVILAAQGEKVSAPADLRRVIWSARQQRRPYLALLLRDKTTTRWVTLSIGDAR